MKRILLIFVLLYSVQFAFAQFTGSGTYSDPYTGGTLSSDLTWNPGTDSVYVNGDLTIGTSGHLTIDPGVFIKFLSSGCDILINGTGRLSANGSVDDSITFTADFDKDKVHGESGERWGHISFESSTGSSSIEYCIIEYGYKSGSGLEGYGGGIHINSNTVTVENCTIKNNYALWGGGIFVNKSVYPSISKCYFYNNQSAHAGGGIYFWNGASSTVTNCIFEINKSLELTYVNYTGGGLGTGSSCIIKIVNCTFVNNTSSLTQGQSLTLDRSASSKVINSIFWGSSDKQIYCYSTSSASSVINCAYRGITYTNGSPVNPVILNSNNDAPDGPNFTDPGSSDWSIKFVSICRDVGVNSYIGVSIPSTDYNGDPTIYTKDIGTYEVQYSRWTGASGSSWTNSGNWEDGVTPSTGTVDIIIPSGITNYPVETGTVTMGTGNYLILNPKAQATFGILENTSTGTLWLKSDSYIINDSIA